MSEIMKVSTETIKEKITNKIREGFVNLIPDEQWDALVQGELDNFTCATSNGIYGSKESPLKIMIREGIEEIFRKKVADELSKPEWSDMYTDGRNIASELVSKIVKENAAELVEGLMGSFTQNVVMKVRQDLINNVNPY